MTQITINGQELRMSYNLKTAITFERMTGKNPLALQPTDFTETEYIITIAYCMLLSNNDAGLVPAWDDYLNAFDINSTAELMTKAAAEVMAYFRPDKGDKQPEPQSETDEEQAPKND